MDNLLCDGTESKVKNCRFDGWGSHDCNVSEAAGIICADPSVQTITKALQPRKKVNLVRNKNAELRLYGGNSIHEGQVEVRYWCGVVVKMWIQMPDRLGAIQ